MTSPVLVLVCVVLGPAEASAPARNLRPLYDAIRTVETGSMARPDRAVGDGGKSLGPYQISRAYLKDSGLNGDWIRCRERAFSEAVMLAYWKRHCPEALGKGDFQSLARVHNGGPLGHRKSATIKYWKLVQGVLKSDAAATRTASAATRRKGRIPA